MPIAIPDAVSHQKSLPSRSLNGRGSCHPHATGSREGTRTSGKETLSLFLGGGGGRDLEMLWDICLPPEEGLTGKRRQTDEKQSESRQVWRGPLETPDPATPEIQTDNPFSTDLHGRTSPHLQSKGLLLIEILLTTLPVNTLLEFLK